MKFNKSKERSENPDQKYETSKFKAKLNKIGRARHRKVLTNSNIDFYNPIQTNSGSKKPNSRKNNFKRGIPESLDLVEVRSNNETNISQNFNKYKQAFKATPGVLDFRESTHLMKSYHYDKPPANFTIINKRNKTKEKKTSLVLAKSEGLGIGRAKKKIIKHSSELGSVRRIHSPKRPQTGVAKSSQRFRQIQISRRDTEYQNLKKEIDITNKELSSSIDIKSISKRTRFEDSEPVQSTIQNQDLSTVLHNKRPMTGSLRNNLAIRASLNNSSGNIRITKRSKRRNDSLGFLKTDLNYSYNTKPPRHEKVSKFGNTRDSAVQNSEKNKTSRSLLQAQNQTNVLAKQMIETYHMLSSKKKKDADQYIYSDLKNESPTSKASYKVQIRADYAPKKEPKGIINNEQFNMTKDDQKMLEKILKSNKRKSSGRGKRPKFKQNNEVEFLEYENQKFMKKRRNRGIKNSRSKSNLPNDMDMKYRDALKRFKRKHRLK
ncbi:unnamed protein product [Moneuplotes crassus]|uniref:Uncharacterized protein n=1 Tax=Euplotes crassus TaxID=5936 RepID=A0AAD1X7G1_EUPCR|nr:unnamed protein product [Moneuplotes crassus]